jgi:hypothetical protein
VVWPSEASARRHVRDVELEYPTAYLQLVTRTTTITETEWENAE